jgi:hypothetical protein
MVLPLKSALATQIGMDTGDERRKVGLALILPMIALAHDGCGSLQNAAGSPDTKISP